MKVRDYVCVGNVCDVVDEIVAAFALDWFKVILVKGGGGEGAVPFLFFLSFYYVNVANK